METQAPTRARLAVMVLFSLSCIGLLLFVWTSFGGDIPLRPKGYRFHVDFDEATQLSQQADVRISGVTVGHVIATAPTKHLTKTTIELDPKYAPLRADAQAILRSKTLLGETYVELTPGTPGSPQLPEGGDLRQGQVHPTQELDEIVRQFDPRTRRALRTWLTSWSAALRARGQDLSDALGTLPQTTENFTTLLTILDSQHAAVSRLVRNTGQVFGAVGSRTAATRTLISAGDQVLATTARRNTDLANTVRILPTFLRELRPTLAAAETTAVEAAPVVHALRPVAPLLRPTLAATSDLAPDAKALFHDLGPLITVSRTGLPALTRIVRASRPLVDVLYPVGREAVPVVDYLGLFKREFVTAWSNTAAASQATDTPPGSTKPVHYIRTLVPFTDEGFVTASKRLPNNRHNPYLNPGGLEALAQGKVIHAFDCENLKNPPYGSLGAAPPCLVQKPLRFRGSRGAFTHLYRDGP